MSTTRRKVLQAATTTAAIASMHSRNVLAAVPGKKLTLLHLTDTHAQLETHWEYMPSESTKIVRMGGFARLKTAIDRQRELAAGPVFSVDGGDLIQGSGPAAWSTGQVMIEPSNALDLDVFVPGNWEPVYGPQAFLNLMGQLKAQVTAFNFHDKSSGQRLFEPYVKLNKEGVRVVFVGIADAIYSVAGCEREGEPIDLVCRIRGVRNVEYVKQSIHEAMLASLHQLQSIAPKRESRSRAIDLPERALSQDGLLQQLYSNSAEGSAKEA